MTSGGAPRAYSTDLSGESTPPKQPFRLRRLEAPSLQDNATDLPDAR